MITKNLSFDQLAPASTPVVASATNPFTFLRPTRENLPAVAYNSTILKVEPAYETTLEADEDGNPCETQGKLKHIDVFHELTNANGVADIFRFRMYPEFDGINKWADKMKNYGFTGDITEVIGLREVVKIGHGAKSNYAYIADRQLVALPTPKTANNSAEASAEAEVKTVSEAKPSEDKPRHRGIISSHKNRPSKGTGSQMKKLILDDDDDEFDDLDEYLESEED